MIHSSAQSSPVQPTPTQLVCRLCLLGDQTIPPRPKPESVCVDGWRMDVLDVMGKQLRCIYPLISLWGVHCVDYLALKGTIILVQSTTHWD